MSISFAQIVTAGAPAATTAAAVAGATTAVAAAGTAAAVTFASVVGAGGTAAAAATNTFTATDASGHTWSTSNPLNTDNYEYYTCDWEAELIRAQFLVPYLQAHELSWPSFRYAYILWFVIGGLLIVWAILHALFRGHGGVLSALMRKATVRRIPLGGGSKVVNERKSKLFQSGRNYTASRPKPVQRSTYATPTIGQMGACLAILMVVFSVSYFDNDYLSPTECTFGGLCTAQVSQGPPASTFGARLRERAFDAFDAPLPVPARLVRPRDLEVEWNELAKRQGVFATNKLNPSGWAPFNDPLLASTNYPIAKNLWTSSSRLGLIAYALIPLSVTLALKLWPFAIFATPFLTNYSFDKAAIFHRWIGRIVWALSTVHVGLWAQQLTLHYDPYGEQIFYTVWIYWRFKAGVAAYVALTFMVVLSLGPVRHRFYEAFYWSHVGLAIAFMVGCLLHFRVLMWWAIIGLGLWGAERGTRFLIWLHLNGFTRGIGLYGKSKQLMRQRLNGAGDEEKRQSGGYLKASTGSSSYGYAHPNAAQSGDTLHDPYSTFGYSKSGMGSPSPSMYGLSVPPSPLPFDKHAPLTMADKHFDFGADAISPPPGYAVAQLLPGKTIRLTLRPARAVHWRPGQHVLLTVPAVRWWQSHPYTLANADGHSVGLPKNDLVFLLRARQGFSRDLYRHVASLRRSNGAGVLVRAQISLPMGSAARTKWGDYKTVFLVVGGTGVSFGLGVFDYVCRRMAARDSGRATPDKRPFQTTQVHFLWIVREWAHLAWIAPTVQACLQMCTPGSVRISLYITKERGAITGPNATPGTLYVTSMGVQPTTPPRPTRAGETHDADESALDYVLFDGEDAAPSAEETAASSSVRRAGTLRRQRSLKAQQPPLDPAHELSYPPRPGYGQVRSASPGLSPDRPWVLRERQSSMGSLASSITLDGAYDQPDSSPYRPPPRSSSSHATTLAPRPVMPSPSASAVALSLRDDVDGPLLDVTGADREALDAISELAIEARPRLPEIFDEEIKRAQGAIIVGCCGPPSLNILMRKLVAERISPMKILKGDQRGNIDIVSEDFS